MTKKFGSLSQEFQPLGFGLAQSCLFKGIWGSEPAHEKISLFKKKSGDKEHSEELASLE